MAMRIIKELKTNGCTNKIQQWLVDSGYGQTELQKMFHLSEIGFTTMMRDPRKHMNIWRMEILSIIAGVTPKEVFEELLIRGKKIKDVTSKEELSLLMRLERQNGIRNNKALACRTCKRPF